MRHRVADTELRDESCCDRTSGIVRVRSTQSVEQTVERLKELVSAKGARLFAVVDHAEAARSAGLEMPPTIMLIFGSARAGTPLMLARPSIALDLPLKVLIAEDANGAVWMSYRAPEYLAACHDLPADFLHTLEAVEAIVAAAQGAEAS